LIGGDLDIDKEGSEQMIVTNTRAHELPSPRRLSPYRCNRGHKQEQERTQLNCRRMIILKSWSLTNRKGGETVYNRLI
jgi:hypothetical protein